MRKPSMGKLFDFVKEREILFGCCAALAGSLVVAFFSLDRTFFTFSTETDYIARNLREAQRFWNGEAMLLQFHPPFYSIVLAFVQTVFRNWFATGLVVSWISSTVVLITSFLFFYHLAGRSAAWGSLAGLATSRLFLTYSSFATQDMFFLAIYSSCFLLAITAMRKESRPLWALTGVAVGCALLTRANGLTLLLLLVFPWFQQRDLQGRLKDFGCILVAFIIVLGAWGVTAKLTHSPFGPRLGHVNLAMRYFPTEGDPYTVEARQQLMAKFHGYKDVILHDPLFIAKTYVKDFLQYLKRNFMSTELLAFPLILFALPGIFLLFFVPHGFFVVLFLIATASQICLLALKEYEARFYLFLIPVLAAGAGVCLQHLWTAIPRGWKRYTALLLFLPFLVPGMRDTQTETYRNLHAQDAELGEVIPAARNLIDPNGVLVCRKEHIPFYLGVRHEKLPDFKNFKDFHSWVAKISDTRPIYVYFGSDEKRSRPQLADLAFEEKAPGWLESISRSRTPDLWVLYRYQPEPVSAPAVRSRSGGNGKE